MESNEADEEGMEVDYSQKSDLPDAEQMEVDNPDTSASSLEAGSASTSTLFSTTPRPSESPRQDSRPICQRPDEEPRAKRPKTDKGSVELHDLDLPPDLIKVAEVVKVIKVPMNNQDLRRKYAEQSFDAFCAFANCGGGIVYVANSDAQESDSGARWKHQDKFRHLLKDISVSTFPTIPPIPAKIKDEKCLENGIVYFVKGSHTLHTRRKELGLKVRYEESAIHVQDFDELRRIIVNTADPLDCGVEIPHFEYNKQVPLCKVEGKFEFKLPEEEEERGGKFKKKKKLPKKKDNLAEKIWKLAHNSVCAFANTHGGVTVIGVNDKGICEGVLVAKEEKEQVQLYLQHQLSRLPCLDRKAHESLKDLAALSLQYHDLPKEDSDGSHGRCVISLRVPALPGGVFTRDPNCSFVDDIPFATRSDARKFNYVQDCFKPKKIEVCKWKKKVFGSDPQTVDDECLKFENLSLQSRSQDTVFRSIKDECPKLVEKHFSLQAGDKAFPVNGIGPKYDKTICDFLAKLRCDGRFTTVRSRVIASKSWARDLGLDFLYVNSPCMYDLLICTDKMGIALISVYDDESKANEAIGYNKWTALQLRKQLWQRCNTVNVPVLPAAECVTSLSVETFMKAVKLEDFFPESWKLRNKSDIEKFLITLATLIASYPDLPISRKMGVTFFNMLTEQQYSSLIEYSRSPLLFVNGPAGTGKTVLAIERICWLCKKGVEQEKILYMCENTALKETVGFTLHQRGIRRCRIITREGFNKKFDTYLVEAEHAILDEVQQYNVDSLDWYETIKGNLLTGQSEFESEYKSLWVFYDLAQCTHRKSIGLPRISRHQQVSLDNVIRNSVAVFDHVNKYRKEKPRIAHDVKGELTFMKLQNSGDVAGCLEKLLNDYCPSDIAVLAPKQNCAVTLKSELQDVYNRENDSSPLQFKEAVACIGCDDTSNAIVIDSVERFGGQEKPVVVLYKPKFRNAGYMITAITRGMLQTIIPEDSG